MATVKIKLRNSILSDHPGTIYFQVIHNRVARQQTTNYRLFPQEWDPQLSCVILPTDNTARRDHLRQIEDSISHDLQRLSKIISAKERSLVSYTADDVVAEFRNREAEYGLFAFMESVIAHRRSLGKIRISETYTSTLNSFKRFRRNHDLPLEDIDSNLMMAYESWLLRSGLCPNSTSFYMRNLRAIYNRAVDKNLTAQRFPFKHVYTGVDKTLKRAVGLNVIRQIKELDLQDDAALDFARDLFLFSFYTRGMSFVDMAYLRKRDLNGKALSYRRRKTGQLLYIHWERCMQDIVDKYPTPKSPYLLPIINPEINREQRRQYIYAAHKVNHSLKIIGLRLGLTISLTMYVSRHAWASIAHSKNVPLSVISEGMGHNSEATTRIYLASLDTAAIDKANKMILRSL